jgi:predicted phosphoadenosine phosphosulfate sulfurtransferase
MSKRFIGKNVLQAAIERIEWTFDSFHRIYCSFSAGKDSTAMMHLVMDEARRRNKRIGVLFIDWECQFSMTINHARKMFDDYAQWIDPYWVSIPMTTWNGCSQHEPEWICWEHGKQWVRDKENISIADSGFFDFYKPNMMFEEFVPLFGQWYARGERTACFVGIRTQESLNRFRTIARSKPMIDCKSFTTNVIDDCWNVYPIYDWKTEDIWTYAAKSGTPQNPLYSRMHQAGLTIHQMRICEPFGDTQRKGLWLYQVIEPEMWAKMVARVAGANTGALYANESGNILGNSSLVCPVGHTWKTYVKFLLTSMPPKTAEHYRNKIAVYLKWWSSRGYENGIPCEADKKLESIGKAPSWRKIAKTILRNDYWCRWLGFSPTKTAAYAKYTDLMRRRRKEWNISDIEPAPSQEPTQC